MLKMIVSICWHAAAKCFYIYLTLHMFFNPSNSKIVPTTKKKKKIYFGFKGFIW